MTPSRVSLPFLLEFNLQRLISTERCLPCEQGAAGGGVATLVAAGPPEVVAPVESADIPAVEAAPASSALPEEWEGILCIEGETTGDGRLIENDSLRWEDLPIPIRYAPKDNGGHGGAEVVGLITSVERRDGGVIWGEGTFDLGSDIGREAARVVNEQITNGVSVDLDDVSFEIRVAKDLLEAEEEAMAEDGIIAVIPAAASTEALKVADAPAPPNGEAPADPADAEKDSKKKQKPGEDAPREHETIIEILSDDELQVTTSARIRAATIVAIPAFNRARIACKKPKQMEDGAEPPAAEGQAAALVAGAGRPAPRFPVEPPAAWFSDPSLSGPTPLTVTDDGRVYGHVATWGTCHIGHAHQGCITPPYSRTGYAYFRVGTVRTAEGTDVAVGHLTLETTHAPGNLTAAQALAHYENTGKVLADLAAGEDAHGIWVAGALRPRVSPEQVRALRSAPMSGDWREVAGNLEMVAVLGVNVPGFPLPRPSGFVASGRMQSLVASGMVPPVKVLPPGHPMALSIEDLRYLKRLAARERAAERAALHAKVETMAAARREEKAKALRARMALVR